MRRERKREGERVEKRGGCGRDMRGTERVQWRRGDKKEKIPRIIHV